MDCIHRESQPSTTDAFASALDQESSEKWNAFLILYNVSKKHNIGTICRCATAFHVKQVCLVGARNFNVFGSHGADAHVSFRHYKTLEECCTDLKQNEGCTIVGVEIMDSAHPVENFPFTGSVGFMIGNEGQGLNEKQIRLCDSFVYIPQYGPGTASLNVAVATSIVLHHYALKAGYTERSRTGFKFDVAEKPRRTIPKGFLPPTSEEKAAERAIAAESAAADIGGLDFSEQGLPGEMEDIEVY